MISCHTSGSRYKSEYSNRFRLEGYNRIHEQEEYDFYKRWNQPDFPRILIIEILHPTPYYDDSYAVNSASQGPYGDAITYEPEFDLRFVYSLDAFLFNSKLNFRKTNGLI